MRRPTAINLPLSISDYHQVFHIFRTGPDAMSEYKRVLVMGLGYIGLPTAAVIASRKQSVLGIDIRQEVVDTINNGDIHIVEPDLDIIVRAVVSQGYLKASTTPEAADVFIIAVPTPFVDEQDHEPNLSYVEMATRAIAKVIEPGNLVILESTSPVGTTSKVAQWLTEERPDINFPQHESDTAEVNIAHCPERVLPGQVLTELIKNDRVIGGMTPQCSTAAIELYKSFVEADMLVTNARTAELCKLVENSFRDVNIAFANELSIIADKAEIDVWELIRLANHHPRVNILQPGTGVGGHCIAVDPWFIVSQSANDAKLIRTSREVNDHKPAFVVDRICEKAKAMGTNKVTCYGLTFKPNIDDLRESPALEVVDRLLAKELSVTLVEPNIESLPEGYAKSKCKLVSLNDSLSDTNNVRAILVAHQQFTSTDKLMGSSTLDFCGAFEPR